MYILGISAFYHDSAAALLREGEIVAAAHEERFTRKKHDAGFPRRAIEYCLREANISLSAIDAFAFYDKPLLKFERLLETYYAFAPRGLRSFLLSMPVWLKEKMFLKKLIRDELKAIEEDANLASITMLFPEHHLSHAASAYYASPFSEAAILTIDGVGEWATASIAHGSGANITVLKELHFPHSVGLLYSAFTYFLGFKVNSGEYKLMGLAPYGDPTSPDIERYMQIIYDNICTVYNDGSVWLNQEVFDYATGLHMVRDDVWEKLFGFPVRKGEGELTQQQCNLALAIQRVTEDIVLKMASEAQRLTGSRRLAMAGGVALNCVANGKLLRTGIFDELFIQPAAGDAGGALGAAYAAYHIYYGKPRVALHGRMDAMNGAYLGPEASNFAIEETAKKFGAVYRYYEDFQALVEDIASILADGKVVGWHQGRMEWGPRALGNRSILADARNPNMQKHLNLKIKYREGFRPFAPSVLAEDAAEYFDINVPSPYMLLIADVVEKRRNPLPAGYHAQDSREKLYFVRSDLPAVTHLDYSARLQTVHKETNPRYYALLSAFKKLTGYGVLVNTSFNVRGEPIVCTPEDSYRCFMRTDMDYLVIGNFVFDKAQQPELKESDAGKAMLTSD
ncbi:MAG: carbamoyltransferase [Bacteroidota bacterium]|nr:carbamoyltransferase [Candidatus Kapabacteria bacterium]MDW8219509.1 carbamoyltransferase [Bacteroidota bacterium]